MEQSKYFVPFLISAVILGAIALTWLAVFMVDVFICVWFLICLAIFVWASS
ncbi:hypothetical protein [Enterococcus phage SSsP-1]|uniref:Uncharacterized protein n=1 Tax=Enterococcus phage SSsP-1 TaxID=2859527 RepID=A0AAE7WE87_9CAUD|nr:hypothetical protein [Enterococcus phage SSsP-1]